MFRNYFIIQDPPNFILLLPGEVSVVDMVGDLDLGDINLGRGGHEVALVDPPHGAAVKLEGAGHQQQPGVQGLQHNHALACKTQVRMKVQRRTGPMQVDAHPCGLRRGR